MTDEPEGEEETTEPGGASHSAQPRINLRSAMPGARAYGWIGAVWLCCASCDQSEAPPTENTAPVPTVTTAAAGSDEPSGEEPKKQRLAGRYSCEFRAARAAVTVPAGVPYATWQEDDGSAASGPGKLVIEVDAEGQVVGTATGALGELRLRGAVDENELRAGAVPADEAADLAMRGTFLGTMKAGAIEAELRVSSHDGALARAARCTLLP